MGLVLIFVCCEIEVGLADDRLRAFVLEVRPQFGPLLVTYVPEVVEVRPI